MLDKIEVPADLEPGVSGWVGGSVGGSATYCFVFDTRVHYLSFSLSLSLSAFLFFCACLRVCMRRAFQTKRYV